MWLLKKMRGVKLGIILLLCTLLAVSSVGSITKAEVHYLNGYYWPSGPDPLTYRYYNYLYPLDSISQATQDAFTMATYYWNIASGTPVDFDYTTGSADIYCFEEENENTGASGRWVAYQPYGYELITAFAIMNTHKTAGYSSEKRISVGGHELGHCLGLAHHFGTLMTEDDEYRYDIFGLYYPHSVDIDELNYLY